MHPSFSTSRFNLYLGRRDDDLPWIIANTFSGAVHLADEELLSLIQSPSDRALARLDAQAPALRADLEAGGFIVDSGVDELRRLALRFEQAKYDRGALTLTVIPTAGCNLDCPYCYESHKGRMMTDEVVAQIVPFVERRAPGLRALTVTWFGGEPLLGKRVLVDLSARLIALCEARQIAYYASIITNGTLLDAETADALMAARITHVQITLDGPAPVHDARRYYARSRAPSFDDVLAGIRNCRGKLPVNIRINVDRSNIDSYPELVAFLVAQGLAGPGSDNSVSLGYVKDWTDTVKTDSADILSSAEFEAHAARLRSLLQAGTAAAPAAPGPGLGSFRPKYPCAAVFPSSYVIMPDGALKKCWVHVGGPHAPVGDLAADVDYDRPAAVRWEGYDPTRDAACAACSYLPVCAGGCPYEMMDRRQRKPQHCAFIVAETERAIRDAVAAGSA